MKRLALLPIAALLLTACGHDDPYQNNYGVNGNPYMQSCPDGTFNGYQSLVNGYYGIQSRTDAYRIRDEGTAFLNQYPNLNCQMGAGINDGYYPNGIAGTPGVFTPGVNGGLPQVGQFNGQPNGYPYPQNGGVYPNQGGVYPNQNNGLPGNRYAPGYQQPQYQGNRGQRDQRFNNGRNGNQNNNNGNVLNEARVRDLMKRAEDRIGNSDSRDSRPAPRKPAPVRSAPGRVTDDNRASAVPDIQDQSGHFTNPLTR